MSERPSICPVTRRACGTALPCYMIHCAKARGLKPISERSLTTAERYELHVAEQRQFLVPAAEPESR